jgi:hypothetical protein
MRWRVRWRVKEREREDRENSDIAKGGWRAWKQRNRMP